MKTLFDCKKGEELKVVKLHATSEFKQRLISFGILKGAKIKLLEHAPAKSTIEIQVGKMTIALRAEEAKMIEVE